MDWFTRNVLARIAPTWALQRTRAAAAVRAYYEAAQTSRTRMRKSARPSANSVTQRDAASLCASGRLLDANLDIATGILDVLVNNVVGTGIHPEPQVKRKDGTLATEVNDAIRKLYADWSFNPEVTWQWDYGTAQRLAARSWLRDGEVFGQRLSGKVAMLDHGTKVPYSIELLEADFVPYDRNDLDGKVVQGIELNDWGRPRAYHVYKTHPGENGSRISTDTKRVPAERMLHLKFSRRLHQIRGVSILHSVITRLDDVKDIDESERVAARVAAAMAAFIRKGTPDLYVPPTGSTEVDEEGRPLPRNMDFTPGMVFDDLRPGEDVGMIDPKRPNNALIPFRDSQLRAAAAGSSTSYSSISKNYAGTYSSQRQELVEVTVAYRTLSNQFVARFCQPVYDGFVDAILAANLLKDFGEYDEETIYDASHALPAMPWIDPEKEAKANQIDEERGYKSRSRIIRERGMDPNEINQEILRDQEEAERLGLKIGAAAAPKGPNPFDPNAPVDPNDPNADPNAPPDPNADPATDPAQDPPQKPAPRKKKAPPAK